MPSRIPEAKRRRAAQHDQACPLWKVLDLILEAYAVAVIYELDVASFALMTALALGDHLGLPESAVHRMSQSAAAAAKRKHGQSPPPPQPSPAHGGGRGPRKREVGAAIAPKH